MAVLCAAAVPSNGRTGGDGEVYLPVDVSVVLFLPESEGAGVVEKVIVVSFILSCSIFPLGGSGKEREHFKR